MNIKYSTWIADRYETKEAAKNNCSQAVRDMVDTFPELSVRVGGLNGLQHCWCVDDDDNIIDPTAAQFEGSLDYNAVAARFLDKSEFDRNTGVVYLNRPSGLTEGWEPPIQYFNDVRRDAESASVMGVTIKNG